MNNCRFEGNKSVVGGGLEYYYGIEAKITNCEFVNNTAEFCGGGVYIGGIFWTEFSNNTISGNTSDVEGGGLCLDTTHEINIRNSIINNNDAPVAVDLLMKDYEVTEWDADAHISYSVVYPENCLAVGENHRIHFDEGIISANPEFYDPLNGNYQLSRRSPCIDNGQSDNTMEYDCNGQPRLVGSGVDIGAFEYQIPMQQGANLFMDKTYPTAGDDFNLEVVSVTGNWSESVELAVMLDINGNTFFYPNWKESFSSVVIPMEYGRKWQQILQFKWPDDIGSAAGLAFWSVLLDPENHSVVGDPDVIQWSYY